MAMVRGVEAPTLITYLTRYDPSSPSLGPQVSERDSESVCRCVCVCVCVC
jgi:hypothetical protein